MSNIIPDSGTPVASPHAHISDCVKVVAIVVTHNRAALLKRCLDALALQTCKLHHVVVVDNASTDTTSAAIAERNEDIASGWLQYERLAENRGGAGGFAYGLGKGVEIGADWVWMMDDDAEAEPHALSMLLADDPSPTDVIASVPHRGGTLSWPVTWHEVGKRRANVAHQLDELPERSEVGSHPFLGFMIHRSLIERIGLPDARLFISADDIEYSLRARAGGAKIVLVRASRISHPVSTTRYRSLLGRRIALLTLAPWRRYYDTRNRLLVARRHHGYRFWTEAIPGTLGRMVLIALYEPHKIAQLKAAAAGLWDGLRGNSGKRHDTWHL